VRTLRRAILLAVLAAVAAPTTASAAPRMWVGFQDDPSFRWVGDRYTQLDRAEEANATVIRTTVYWSKVAPKRPQIAANPFDAAYRLDDLDEMVRESQKRGLEVMLTLWGTPKWAGPAENRLPRRLIDFQNFARALADRYSGRYAGYPHVRFFSIWNEPNRGIFLSPQFDARGRSVAPKLYAQLARAGYAGVKRGNPQALVAIGETASNGRDRAVSRSDRQETHSPGRFAELLAAVKPRLRFDAWAHHPYPTSPAMRPTQKMRWPNVSLASLPTFEKALDGWFKRKRIPVWITEYGHETKPDKRGVSPATQRAFLSKAFAIARKDERVQMFIWFILRDRPSVPWQSGLLTAGGAKKLAFATFTAAARAVDARSPIVETSATNPVVRVSALPIAFHSPVGEPIGVTYTVWDGRTAVVTAQPLVQLERDGWITLRPTFTPQPGRLYRLTVEAGDINGNFVHRTVVLTRPRPAAKK
jgi:hypothetical protein